MQIGENASEEMQRAARWRELRRGFLADAARLAAAAAAIPRAAPGLTLNDDEKRSLRLLAHRLRGSAGFFAFDALGVCAATLEDAVLAGAPTAALAAAAEHLEQQVRSALGDLEA